MHFSINYYFLLLTWKACFGLHVKVTNTLNRKIVMASKEILLFSDKKENPDKNLIKKWKKICDRVKFVGNKVKGRISKQVFQENKARQIFRKMNISYPLIMHTYVCVSVGKKCSFFRKFDVLCFLATPVLRFALSPYYRRVSRQHSVGLFK